MSLWGVRHTQIFPLPAPQRLNADWSALRASWHAQAQILCHSMPCCTALMHRKIFNKVRLPAAGRAQAVRPSSTAIHPILQHCHPVLAVAQEEPAKAPASSGALSGEPGAMEGPAAAAGKRRSRVISYSEAAPTKAKVRRLCSLF